MSVENIHFSNGINFRENSSAATPNLNTDIKSDLVNSPDKDEFTKEKSAVKPKKKHTLRNICLGIIGASALFYGSIVLKHKLSKPSFEEVQKCIKEIFEKDLSDSEVKDLLAKYKEICKNGNTDEFTTKMIEQLKKDYGIEGVQTKLNITKLKDNSIKTRLEQTKLGDANPLGEINIMPSTHSDNIIRSVQCDTFSTGFHELKHMRQFADAYRADPDKFAEVLLKKVPQEEIIKAVESQKTDWKNLSTKLHNGDEESIKNAYESIKNNPKYKGVTKDMLKNEYAKMSESEIYNILSSLYKTDADIEKAVRENTKNFYKKALEERFGSLERYKEGSVEHKKGLEYIDGYDKYIDAEKDYDSYRKNILEEEAFKNGDLAKKIYRYVNSIWKI